MFCPDQNRHLLQPRLGVTLPQQSKTAVHTKAQVKDDGRRRFSQIRHDVVQMVLGFHHMGDQLHAVITQFMQGFGASVRKGGLVLYEEDDFAKLAHLLVQVRQGRLGDVTRPVIHDFYQRLGKKFVVAFALRQFLLGYAWLVRILGERGNVLRTDLSLTLALIHARSAPCWKYKDLIRFALVNRTYECSQMRWLARCGSCLSKGACPFADNE